MAGVNTNTLGVIANTSTDISWYVTALQNSGAAVQCYSEDAFTSHATPGLPRDSLILVAEPVAETCYSYLEAALTSWGRHDVRVIAASVSHNSIFVAGPSHTVNAYLPLLRGPAIPVHHVSRDFGSAAKLQLVHDHLMGVHVVAATEAMGLAARAGLNTSQIYNIIVKAAGHSTAFETRAKKMLTGDWTPGSTLNQTADKLAKVLDRARDLHFPLPLASAAEQLYIMASSLGHGAADDSAVIRAYMPTDAGAIKEATRRSTVTNELTPTSSPGEIASVGMVGLGAMGQGMAASLLRAGFAVNGFDMNATAVSKFVSNGPKARGVSSAADAMSNSAVVVLMVQNATQADDILFGPGNGVESLSDHTVVILSSTVPPSFVRKLGAKLQNLGRGISLLDAPVSGGVARAANDAWSWMMENRTGQMLDADWTPHSALAIFVKDLGIVLNETKRLGFYSPIASAAHTLYLNGAAHGWEKEADAGVVRLWELAGVSVSGSARPPSETIQSSKMNLPRLPAAETLASLPKEYQGDVLSSIKRVVESGQVPTLVILDDDPTGTQTCHDINVLAVWDAETLAREFIASPVGFFILTNSRALPSSEARRLIMEICENVKAAATKAKKTFEIVLRGDSTLRGHLPEEPEAVEEALGQFDGWVLTPFFSQGGRLTIDDVHYVREVDVLVPVSQTPFAQDATFGYKNSNLRRYILEKCGPRFDEGSFLSISLDDIRLGGPSAVAQKLLSVPSNPDLVIIVNAVVDADMHVFVAGLLKAEQQGRRYLFRTGAAFVSSRLAIPAIPPLTLDDLGVDKFAAPHTGGLVLAGSYVPKTTAQLQRLRERRGDELHVLELPVTKLVSSARVAEALVGAAAQEASETLAAGKDVLVMTSRELVKGTDALSSLSIGSKVAQALVALMGGVNVRPRYIIAKGGITSSDAATKSLRMRRARVLGQAAPGVPLWMCTEETSRHRAVPYVVFPGNVGSEDTLADIVESWAV
ncbi:3-hydroxyacid dehydrogenase/reductase [Cordyceps javanica]|nr:3-hydroxyacid dehydrogenase/reductase [Cordyceps javanica]